ncbi:MAG: TonB-dependent receptor plug domain-containing protein, partial [Alistipes sp.]
MEKILQKILPVTVALMFALNSWAQGGGNISGQVTDEQGSPLIGVTVMIQGSSIGASTDTHGHYSISLGSRQSAILNFSYVGMKSRAVVVSRSKRTADVQMQANTDIEEVIVQGYGRIQKREDLVGSAFQVNAKDLQFKPITRIDNILDGMVPGMSIQPNTDAPSSTRTRYNTRIRGEASLSASNEPLWIVDGVPIYTGNGTNTIPGMSYSVSPLSFINPDDIESLTVLKDASEVSIYGADGANGVILVTTKNGKLNAGKTTVNATFRYGIASVDESTRFKVLNASQYMNYAK